MANVNFLTKEWYKKLLQELKVLKEERLPEVLWRLKDAIGQWDISENAEYETAIQEKDLVEARIVEIEDLLQNVQIIEEATWGNEVKYWSWVQIKNENNKIVEFTIVGSWEVDVIWGTISFESPLWIAIKWKRRGDVVSVRSPKWKYNVEILDIK